MFDSNGDDNNEDDEEDTTANKYYIEVKQVRRNGVESSAEEPWLYVYGNAQLTEIHPKRYVQWSNYR